MVEHELDRRLIGLDAPGAALQQPPRAGGEQGRLARARHRRSPGSGPRRRSQAPTISSSIPSSSKLGGAPGKTRSVMLTAKPPAACTGARLQRKRRKTPRASATAWEQSMARPPRKIPSPVASKMRVHKPPSATPSSAESVARASLPSTSMNAGAPVWKEMSEAPRFAAHSRKASSRSTGNTCAASDQAGVRERRRCPTWAMIGAHGHCRSPSVIARHAFVSRLNAARLSSRTLVSPIRSRRSWPVAAV